MDLNSDIKNGLTLLIGNTLYMVFLWQCSYFVKGELLQKSYFKKWSYFEHGHTLDIDLTLNMVILWILILL